MSGGVGAERPVAIGVIIVNWRNATDTLLCLESLQRAEPRPPAVVVVDNGSKDGSIERLVEWATGEQLEFVLRDANDTTTSPWPWLTLVRVDTNRGFAGGNNVGLELLRRDPTLTHFLLLNNDAIVQPDYFAVMQPVLAARPHAGLCIGTIYELPDRSRVWYA